ncbi:hypothetical protein L6452_06783 [Arctium lappa]|uniref:Uncharacterized protein n=1 Tax=Arctium lappa TaxID=4217 RepID=A0ACB9EKF1_ARCLA|nr:hypothetical protein L6452_06783 [Arctium lappa]
MDNSKPYLDQENLDDIIVYSHSLEVWNPEYSVAGKEAVRERVLRLKCYFLAIGSARGCDSDGSREDQDGFKENVETPSVWSARPAELAAEEIRRTNAAGGVQNRPAEDGRVHVVEPRAREALKPTPAERRRRRKAVFRIYVLIGQ